MPAEFDGKQKCFEYTILVYDNNKCSLMLEGTVMVEDFFNITPSLQYWIKVQQTIFFTIRALYMQ